MQMDEQYLTTTEIAIALGITRDTISAYKSRGQMPQPDKTFGRTPLWKLSTIQTWRADFNPTK